MKQVPWLTLVAAAIFLVTPLGTDLIHSSFFSGEQLSRSLGQFVLLMFLVGIVALAAIEWGAKVYLQRRRKAGARG